ncbi:hypothetical protein WJX77_003918 [Trebouxia sp. C0004]
MEVTNFDALRCSKCDDTEPEEDFLLCDGCVRGFHAQCLNQDMPKSRFWFCPICAGTTIKGCLIKALESAGRTGLTAAELNAQVLLLRTTDSDEPPLPPEVVAMYNKTTVTERYRLCHGDKGRLEDGRPLVEKLTPSPSSTVRYRLAPEYPSLPLPSPLPVEAPELQPEVIDLLSDSEDAGAELEGAGTKERSEGAEASSAEARADSRDAGSVLENAELDSADTRGDCAHPGDCESLPTKLVGNRSVTSDAAAALHATAAAAQQSTSMIELWPSSYAGPLLPCIAAPCGIAGFPCTTWPTPSTLPEESSAACPAASLTLSPAAPPAASPAALPHASLAPFSAAPPIVPSAATLAAPPWGISADGPPVSERPSDPGLVSLQQQLSEATVPANMPIKLQETLLGFDSIMATSPTAPSGRRCYSRAPLSLRLSPVSKLCSRLDDEEAERQDNGVDDPPTTTADCVCSPAAGWFGHSAPLREDQTAHERHGADPDWVMPDSLEQSSQDNQAHQPEQEDEHDNMHEGFCYVGTHASAYQVTGPQPDIVADPSVNSSTKLMHCQNERVKDVSDGCILCGPTPLQEEVLPTLQLDLQQAEAALQTSIRGDGSSELDAREFSTQQGTGSLSAEAHTAGLCKAVPEASPRQHWCRTKPDGAESDRAEPDRAQSDMAASAELPQVRRRGPKRKRQEEIADHELEVLCKRRQEADGLPWSQICWNLTRSISFTVLYLWLSSDLLE